MTFTECDTCRAKPGSALAKLTSEPPTCEAADKKFREWLTQSKHCPCSVHRQMDIADKAAEIFAGVRQPDPPIVRLQFPDGSAPEDLRECAEGWKRHYERMLSDWRAMKGQRDEAGKELDARAKILDSIQSATGSTWWHGAIEWADRIFDACIKADSTSDYKSKITRELIPAYIGQLTKERDHANRMYQTAADTGCDQIAGLKGIIARQDEEIARQKEMKIGQREKAAAWGAWAVKELGCGDALEEDSDEELRRKLSVAIHELAIAGNAAYRQDDQPQPEVIEGHCPCSVHRQMDIADKAAEIFAGVQKSVPLERHYKKAAKDIGDLFCWCVTHLTKFPPGPDVEWLDDVKRRLSDTQHSDELAGLRQVVELAKVEIEQLTAQRDEARRDASNYENGCGHLAEDVRNLFDKKRTLEFQLHEAQQERNAEQQLATRWREAAGQAVTIKSCYLKTLHRLASIIGVELPVEPRETMLVGFVQAVQEKLKQQPEIIEGHGQVVTEEQSGLYLEESQNGVIDLVDREPSLMFLQGRRYMRCPTFPPRPTFNPPPKPELVLIRCPDDNEIAWATKLNGVIVRVRHGSGATQFDPDEVEILETGKVQS